MGKYINNLQKVQCSIKEYDKLEVVELNDLSVKG